MYRMREWMHQASGTLPEPPMMELSSEKTSRKARQKQRQTTSKIAHMCDQRNDLPYKINIILQWAL
jgi:hypothetical protein